MFFRAYRGIELARRWKKFDIFLKKKPLKTLIVENIFNRVFLCFFFPEKMSELFPPPRQFDSRDMPEKKHDKSSKQFQFFSESCLVDFWKILSIIFEKLQKNNFLKLLIPGIATWLTYQLHSINHHLQSVPAPPKMEKYPEKKSQRKPAFSIQISKVEHSEVYLSFKRSLHVIVLPTEVA